MKATLARREFKDEFGQANHSLITCLVGLSEIETNQALAKPEEFSTSWNPRDRTRSARRSREFVLASFLSRCVDGVDMYLGLLNRPPHLIDDRSFEQVFDRAQNSVLKKVLGVSDFCRLDRTTTSLVLLLITWRNNLTHALAENALPSTYRKHLIQCVDEVRGNFRGLDIIAAIENAEGGKNPRFKEVASLVSASHKFVQLVDTFILQNFDAIAYAKRVVDFCANECSKTAIKLAILDSPKRERFLKNLLLNHGAFTTDDFPKLQKLFTKNAF